MVTLNDLSSFFFFFQGGNGCLLLEEYVNTASNISKADEDPDPRSSHVVVSSARTLLSHHANKRNLLNWLKNNPETRIQDMAYTTTARRTHWPIRYAVTASSTQDLIAKLELSVARENSDTPSMRKSPVVFTFTGQGSHYAGMGAELYRTSLVFRNTVLLCARICKDHQFADFIDIITDKSVDLSTKSPVQIQLSLLTLEIGLGAFWKSIGVHPDMVIGHSLGEYAALHVAGVLSLADVLYLVGRRALLLLERCEAGSCSMLALNASVATVQEHLVTQPHFLCAIACINGPNATVVSGPMGEITQLQDQLAAKGVRSKVLSVPFAFHSLQMDPILDEYNILAGVSTFMEPKVPVASTLLAAVVDKDSTFNANYLAEQARQRVDFVGALNAVKSRLDNPVWLELGPSPVCASFIRTTLSPSPSKIMSTLEAGSNDWASIANCLAGLYQNGVDVDWLGLHMPYEKQLKLQTLPAYAWDLKDYWIPYVEPRGSGHAMTNTATPGPNNVSIPISTCAQYVVQEAMSPRPQVTLGAATTDEGFKAFIDGHRLRGVPVCAGAVFMEAAETAARHLLKYLDNGDAGTIILNLQDMGLTRPITDKSLRSSAELQTTAALDSALHDTVRITFKEYYPSGSSQLLGGCIFKLCDAGLEAKWDRSSFFIKSRMDEIITSAKNGKGHRIQRDIYYALFADTVEYDAPFRGVKEAYVSKDFDEAAAEVVLQPDPTGTKFTSSPYWADSLSQLSGFVVNGNPARPRDFTFMMASLGSYVQTAQVTHGKSYFTYCRISRRQRDTVYCDAFVFDQGQLIIECTNCVFHEVNNGTLDRLLGKPKSAAAVALPKSPQQVARSVPAPAPTHEPTNFAVVVKTPNADSSDGGQGGVFDALLGSIIKATGGDISELTDDTELTDIGVDSIMAIEIVADIKESTDEDIPPSFVLEHPTIGHLRRAFGSPSDSSVPTPSETEASAAGSDTVDDDKAAISAPEKEVAASIMPFAVRKPTDDGSPEPRVRISLLQGRPVPGKPRFFLIADGSGTIATYIHLPPVKVKMPIYGVDSPFLYCPSRFTPEAGIPVAARYIVEALVKAQPEGPFFLGGFSGGAMLSYEVTRQLAALGRKVDSMILIDMCCPRPRLAPSATEDLWNTDIEVFETISGHAGSASVATNTQQHLRAIFKAVSVYHPPSMTANEEPGRTVIIWAQNGMIARCYNNSDVMQKLAERGLTRDPPPGFMEDPSFGAITWSIVNKGPKDLGPNGWEKYIGHKPLCLSVNADHLEMVAPGQVHLLRGALEEAFRHIESID